MISSNTASLCSYDTVGTTHTGNIPTVRTGERTRSDYDGLGRYTSTDPKGKYRKVNGKDGERAPTMKIWGRNPRQARSGMYKGRGPGKMQEWGRKPKKNE